MPGVPVLLRYRQENQEFRVILGYKWSLSLRTDSVVDTQTHVRVYARAHTHTNSFHLKGSKSFFLVPNMLGNTNLGYLKSHVPRQSQFNEVFIVTEQRGLCIKTF